MSALERYKQYVGDDEMEPLERLRAFCSFAMDGKDWLDVETFFDHVAIELANTNYVLRRANEREQSLEAELEALRADAERYRWIKSAPWAAIRVDANPTGWAAPLYIHRENTDDLDSAIDAAITQEKNYPMRNAGNNIAARKEAP